MFKRHNLIHVTLTHSNNSNNITIFTVASFRLGSMRVGSLGPVGPVGLGSFDGLITPLPGTDCQISNRHTYRATFQTKLGRGSEGKGGGERF